MSVILADSSAEQWVQHFEVLALRIQDLFHDLAGPVWDWSPDEGMPSLGEMTAAMATWARAVRAAVEGRSAKGFGSDVGVAPLELGRTTVVCMRATAAAFTRRQVGISPDFLRSYANFVQQLSSVELLLRLMDPARPAAKSL